MTQDMETLGLGLFFEDATVGRKFKTIGRTITEADIINFVTCTGMTEVLFTNHVFQEVESVIQGRVVPSALVYTFIEGLLVQCSMQHTGFAFLEMTYKVGGPTVAGDTIHCEVEVIEARRSNKRPDKGIVSSLNRVMNQRGEMVLEYRPTRMVQARTDGTGGEG